MKLLSAKRQNHFLKCCTRFLGKQYDTSKSLLKIIKFTGRVYEIEWFTPRLSESNKRLYAFLYRSNPLFFYQNSYLIRLQYPIHEKSGCDVPEKVKDDVGKKRKLKI